MFELYLPKFKIYDFFKDFITKCATARFPGLVGLCFCGRQISSSNKRILGRRWRGGYLPEDFSTVESLVGAADHKLFVSIAHSPHHILRGYYHENESSGYNLSTRAHNFLVCAKDDIHFVFRSI